MESNDYLIIGLGNPGAQYAGTRHNIGFMCVEALASTHGITGKSDNKMEAIVGRGTIHRKKITLAQPLTFMNLSGKSVLKLAQYYKIPWEHTLIVYDDTAIPFGKIRFRPDGTAGSHNGMKSIIAVCGTQSIPRLRIGIGEAPAQWDLADFVLAPYTAEEQHHLPKIINTSQKAIELWLAQGTEKAMNQFNSLEIIEPSEEKPI